VPRAGAHLEGLEAAGVRTFEDLAWLLPLRAVPLPRVRPFRDIRPGDLFLGQGKVLHREIKPAFGRRTKGRFLLHNAYFVVQEESGSSTCALRFFNLYPNQRKAMEAWDRIWFLGTPQEWRGQVQLVNPKVYPLLDDVGPALGDWLVEYPTVNKVPGAYTHKIIASLPSAAWSQLGSAFGTDDTAGEKLSDAFRVMHARLPASEVTPERRRRAEERLAYEEFFVDQLKIATRRRFIKRKAAPYIAVDQQALEAFKRLLPFTLTADQDKAVTEILADMNTGHPMMRMVQGDVGCGKTVVAMLAALPVLKAGKQVVLMCPTETLARQHAATLAATFGILPFLRPALLLGSMKVKEKTPILKALADGSVNFVIGTHALFQDTVIFRDLALAIIDEQHKFGVQQRLDLTAKGAGTHCLIMSATPIPRTLALAQYGDLDFTTIKTLPGGRKGIKTRIVEKPNYPKYVDFLRQRLELGDQGYFVFPAIDESETLELQNVKDSFEKYRLVLAPHAVAMLHGKMKAEEKDAVIRDFTAGKIRVLISTTVIEVGINVPNAAFMAVYHPERFGLSSLHQLRGRVGRGDKPGFCFLVAGDLHPAALERLRILEETTDGFAVAEADLQNRGEGDLFGVDQSGSVVRRRVADHQKHAAVLEKVYRDVRELQQQHPEKFDPLLLRLARDQKILDTI
jgi:ATP-dependent DNA helicase RecG